MAQKRKKAVDTSGWTYRAEAKLAGDVHGAPHPLAALATRFALEQRGRVKSTNRRRANAMGLRMATGELESDMHAHRESQLMYMVRGEMVCEAEGAHWIVPPQSALWIPGGVAHRIRARAPLEGYSVFLAPKSAPRSLPEVCCAVSVTPLFRELLLRLSSRPAQYDLRGPDARLVAVLMDELASVTIEPHRLPMPADPRLRKLVDALTARPDDGATAAVWARRIGVGERTLSRLLVAETGLSFGRWRQQLHIVLAIQKLSRGQSVQAVAGELGYERASSFVTMFKKALGTSPARYMAARLGRARDAQT